jgi:hypothetical protein
MTSYTLSPVWGAGAQLFDNSGNVLTGGKIYTYEAGTTTPAVTYTDPTGSAFNSNPIIANASGRLANEIWLPVSGAYKFVLKDTNDVLIATYDNIPSLPQPPIVNDASSISYEQGYAVTAGAFTVGVTYLITSVGTTNFVAIGAAANITGILFTATGVGSGTGVAQYSRTVQVKLQESVSVKDFGAVGNGVANDTTAIQAALTASAGNTVLFPAGTYKVTSALTVGAGTFISAYDATLNGSSSAFKLLTFTNGGGIFGGTLIGSGNATLSVGSMGIYCSGTNNHPSAPTFVTAPTIRDVTINNFGEYGIFLVYTNNAVIENNIITNIGYAGIGGASCNYASVLNNYINGVTPGTTDAYGIFIDRKNGLSETSDPRSYWCSITNNKVFNVVSVSGNNGQGIDTHAGVGFSIIGNEVINCEVGIFVTSSVIAGTNQLAPNWCKVIGNTVRSTLRVGYGIDVSGSYNGATVVAWAENIIVQGNTIEGHGVLGDGTSGAIRITAGKNIVVDGNSISRPACNGIVIDFETRGATVTNNAITDPYDDTYIATACIAVFGNNCYANILSNTCVFENAGLGTYVAINAIRIGAGLTGLDVTLGKHAFIGISATALAYSQGTSTGVNGEGLAAQRGFASISCVSGDSSNLIDITFAKRFPSVPAGINVIVSGVISPGGKSATLRVANVTATGFRIIAYPYDLSTWSASGSLDLNWRVST